MSAQYYTTGTKPPARAGGGGGLGPLGGQNIQNSLINIPARDSFRRSVNRWMERQGAHRQNNWKEFGLSFITTNHETGERRS